MANQKKAYILALSTVLIWSTVASAFKLSLRYMSPVQLQLYASFVSVCVLAVILVVRGQMGAVLASSRRDLLRSIGLGFLNPCLYYLILLKAYDLLPAQEAQPINYTWAITLTLLSIPLLGQRIRLVEIAAILVSYSGVVLISTHGDPLRFHFSSPLGVGLALGSTLIWALYWIYNARDTREPVVALFLNFVFGTFFVLVACVLLSELRLPDLMGLLGAAYVGVFEMGISFVLWLGALKASENTAKVGNLIFISPFVSLLFIHFLVGEQILASTFAGLLLIVAGLILQQATSRSSSAS